MAFAKKLVEISYELVVQTGGGVKGKLTNPLPESEQAKAVTELTGLLMANPLPDFASSVRMRRQAARAGAGGTIFVIIFFIWYTGLGRVIVEIVKVMFGKK